MTTGRRQAVCGYLVFLLTRKIHLFYGAITNMLRGNDGLENTWQNSLVLAEENLELHEEQDGYKVRQKGLFSA